MTVARTWLERGHYGLMLAGHPAPPGLAGALPVVASVVLSMRVLGVGIWQARLPMALICVGVLGLLYFLASDLYDRRIALLTWSVLLFTHGHPDLNVLIMGRQVLGEIPSLLFLLAGYYCLLVALRRRSWMIIPSIILWSVAVDTKAQALPFWAFSLLVPLSLSILKKHRRTSWILGAALSASLVLSRVLISLQKILISSDIISDTPLEGIFSVTAWTLAPKIRLFSLLAVISFGLPTLVALAYAIWKAFFKRNLAELCEPRHVVQLSLLAFVISWMGWFLLIGFCWPRYLFPALFVGSIFVADLVWDLLIAVRRDLRNHAPLRSNFLLLAAPALLLIVGISVSLALNTFHSSFASKGDSSLDDVVHFLNTKTPPQALIESYESEVFILLDRPYHYPPDKVHVDLSRRSYLNQPVNIDYNPLAAKPDYLVVGKFARIWGLYDKTVSGEAFFRTAQFGEYTVYQRRK